MPLWLMGVSAWVAGRCRADATGGTLDLRGGVCAMIFQNPLLWRPPHLAQGCFVARSGSSLSQVSVS